MIRENLHIVTDGDRSDLDLQTREIYLFEFMMETRTGNSISNDKLGRARGCTLLSFYSEICAEA